MVKFTTKRDINGNRYTLKVDYENKVYYRDFNDSWNYDDYITIGKRDREKLIKQLEEQGFTRK